VILNAVELDQITLRLQPLIQEIVDKALAGSFIVQRVAQMRDDLNGMAAVVGEQGKALGLLLGAREANANDVTERIKDLEDQMQELAQAIDQLEGK
jgi:hypothetical protein